MLPPPPPDQDFFPSWQVDNIYVRERKKGMHRAQCHSNLRKITLVDSDSQEKPPDVVIAAELDERKHALSEVSSCDAVYCMMTSTYE